MNTFTIFLVLMTIVSLLLIIVIMIQNPKGGGLDSSLGGSTNIGGVQNTNKFLDRSTWTLALTLMALVLLSSISFTSGSSSGSKLLDENAVTIPTVPAAAQQTAPAATQQEPVTAPAATETAPQPVQ